MRNQPVQILLTEEEFLLLKKIAKLEALGVASFVRNSAICKARKINMEGAVA